jgi:hypothetical protein
LLLFPSLPPPSLHGLPQVGPLHTLTITHRDGHPATLGVQLIGNGPNHPMTAVIRWRLGRGDTAAAGSAANATITGLADAADSSDVVRMPSLQEQFPQATLLMKKARRCSVANYPQGGDNFCLGSDAPDYGSSPFMSQDMVPDRPRPPRAAPERDALVPAVGSGNGGPVRDGSSNSGDSAAKQKPMLLQATPPSIPMPGISPSLARRLGSSSPAPPATGGGSPVTTPRQSTLAVPEAAADADVAEADRADLQKTLSGATGDGKQQLAGPWGCSTIGGLKP